MAMINIMANTATHSPTSPIRPIIVYSDTLTSSVINTAVTTRLITVVQLPQTDLIARQHSCYKIFGQDRRDRRCNFFSKFDHQATFVTAFQTVCANVGPQNFGDAACAPSLLREGGRVVTRFHKKITRTLNKRVSYRKQIARVTCLPEHLLLIFVSVLNTGDHPPDSQHGPVSTVKRTTPTLSAMLQSMKLVVNLFQSTVMVVLLASE